MSLSIYGPVDIQAAPGSIGAVEIADGAIIAGKIAVGGLSAANQLAAGVVDNAAMAAAAVGAGNIAAGGISAANQFAAGVIDNAAIGAGGLVPEKRRGWLAHGRATLVAGVVTVTPGPAVTATDLIEIFEGDGAAGVEAERYVDVFAVGGAGVGTFNIQSGNAGDIAPIGWIQYDNTYVG